VPIHGFLANPIPVGMVTPPLTAARQLNMPCAVAAPMPLAIPNQQPRTIALHSALAGADRL
jgi:hypothetical protein